MTSPRLRPAFSAALSGRTSSISTPPVLPSTMLTPSSPPWPARMVSSRPCDCAKTDGANATARTASPASVAVTADIFSSFIRTPLSARSDEGPCRKVGYNSARIERSAFLFMAKTPKASETKAQILERTEREKVKFMRLQFTDILGTIKNVEIPDKQFEDALDGKIMFDGSSIEGFVRIEESDMYLRPDLATFRIFPWTGTSGEKVARMICDIYTPDGQPFVGDPRACLKKVIALAAAKGYSMNAGPEAEFFLFQTADGVATTDTHDAASYFDLGPVDRGEDVRREIVLALEAMGFHVEAAHHEVAPGQHEIDFRYDDVLSTADNVSTFRFIVKNVAIKNGLHATFMPKP